MLTTGGALLGLSALAVTLLVVWDGGVDLDPRRELLPGVRLDLRTVDTAHGPIEYDLHGADGPVVLSVHAGLGGADQGRLFAGWLRGDRYRILSPSRPGYLGTPLSSGRTLDEQADLLAALLDRLGIDRVGVFAVSAGSPVGYTFAARHPERVWGLVSVSGVARPDPNAAPASALRSAVMNTVGQKIVKLTASASMRSIVAGTLDETSTFSDERKAERVDHIMRTEGARRFFAAMFDATFPYERRWPGTDNDTERTRAMRIGFDRIVAPTLVVHGTQDGDVPFAHGAEAAARIRGARHCWMPDEDHLGFWLSPRAEEFQAVVRQFLRTHAPGR
ncbi:alpha/beta hydrolase [Micromonospora sp. WMMC241]|uniref:alpha/beta fold hydrolase n=1 Tax=Micromonospora sp. WMMC241 TaxID=3015159 RepID=UPI0022B6BEA1|nr:alpha/beta hydrolase [Micromonospora sp. WMMC241]MCZ7438748.1 alpha/beta hydrolase [Micromonospora sp. WMMC241]